MVGNRFAERPVMISRRLIAVTPLLLVLGILAQILLLVAAVTLYIPALLWPGMLDPGYHWIVRGMAKIMTRGMIRRHPKPKAETVTLELRK